MGVYEKGRYKWWVEARKTWSCDKYKALQIYVATVSQILDLQENELDWLPCHLGHDITVHREYYWLHESTTELAKVGKILTTVDEGKPSSGLGNP